MAASDTSRPPSGNGWTVREFARYSRVSPDRVRGWIRNGELGAVNTSSTRCGRPRWIILPHHVTLWEAAHAAVPPSPTPQRRKRAAIVDFYP